MPTERIRYFWSVNTATHGNILQHATATHSSALQHLPTNCNTLHCTATHCSTLQHTTTHHNTRQHTAIPCNTWITHNTHCNTLQHTATHCDTLQRTATQVEDANRGGQTLVTLLVYLNEVKYGGTTTFGKLDLTINPTKGQVLQRVAACCSVLHRLGVAASCIVVAARCTLSLWISIFTQLRAIFNQLRAIFTQLRARCSRACCSIWHCLAQELQRVAPCFTVSLRCCSVLQCVALSYSGVAACCSGLQRFAAGCSVLEYFTMQPYIVKQCNTLINMGWLRLVGSLKLQVSFAKEPYNRDDVHPWIVKQCNTLIHSETV